MGVMESIFTELALYGLNMAVHILIYFIWYAVYGYQNSTRVKTLSSLMGGPSGPALGLRGGQQTPSWTPLGLV